MLILVLGSVKTEEVSPKKESNDVKTPVKKEDVKEEKYQTKQQQQQHEQHNQDQSPVKLDHLSSLTSLSKQITGCNALTSQPLPATGAHTQQNGDSTDSQCADQSAHELLSHNPATSLVGLPTPESSPGSLASPPFPASLVSAHDGGSLFPMESLVPQLYYKNSFFGAPHHTSAMTSDFPYYHPVVKTNKHIHLIISGLRSKPISLF